MRKLIIATAALAFMSSTALAPSIAAAQEKGAAAPSETMSKGEMSKEKTSKKSTAKSKTSAKKSGAEKQEMQKQEMQKQ